MTTRATVLSTLATYFSGENAFVTIQEYDADADKPLPTHTVKRYWSFARLKANTQKSYNNVVHGVAGEKVGDVKNETPKRVALTTTVPTIRNKH